MKNKQLEVLAPAGSPEAVTAAVRAGADAVYLGASAFSARANAQNFDRPALRQAVEYCHAAGVKVYLALNTLLLETELLQALSWVEYAASLPVDALIVQDPGLIRLVQQAAPGIRLHASTQMSIHTPAGARALQRAGFARVVLARELSLSEIRDIHRECPGLELEVFVHGALCMSVSGQCYMSAMLGSRSGNRGQCAQPCRLPFAAPGGTGHDLSLKDLSAVHRLAELKEAGVTSAKIEGRMKRPEYVAAASRACRLSADGAAVPQPLMQNLSAVFSRSGFTDGYLDHRLGRSMFGVRSKEDVTGATSGVLSELRQLYHREMPRVPVCMTFSAYAGKPVSLCIQDAGGLTALAEAQPPQPAQNRPMDPERCREQLAKTGGTLFYPETVECHMEPGLNIPVSVLNGLRRQALKQLYEKRAQRPAIPFTRPDGQIEEHRAKEMAIRARFASVAQMPKTLKGVELVYLPLSAPVQELAAVTERGVRVAVELPRGMFGTEPAVREKLEQLRQAGICEVWAGTIGAAALGKELGMRVHGGFSLNIFNTSALCWFAEFGLEDVELSFELTLPQVSAIGGTLPRGLVTYGRLPLMLVRNCPVANAGGCRNCKTSPELVDRKGIRFPVQCSGGCSEVLNSVPLYLADRKKELQNLDFQILYFSVENSVETGEILAKYGNPHCGKLLGSYTRGLYYRGLEEKK